MHLQRDWAQMVRVGRSPAYRKLRSDSAVTPASDRAKVAVVMAILEALAGAFLAVLRPKASLVVENLVLRQQLAVLRRR
ncbi:MAG: hypothetical protein M3O46_01595, partial [Myxococcota bacterium]|nr:hypothetical protein [Myxococcota bacterium]